MEPAALPLLWSVVPLIIVLFLLVIKIYTSSPAGKRLPPGPWQLPLVGSLHHFLLSRHGDLPHRVLRELSRKHVPLMLLRFGAVPTLVVSSAEAAREVLKTHDAAFASRHLTPTLDIFSRGGQDILFSPYGDLWRQLRRICLLELMSARRVLSFRHIREDEVAALIGYITDECARGGGCTVVEIGQLITRTVNDIVVRSAVGGRCPRRDEFLHVLDRSVKLAGGFNLSDLYPSSALARWLSGALRETERCNRKARAIMDDFIRERVDGAGESTEDLLGVLLRVQKDGGAQCSLDLTTDIITTVVQEMFVAGSETSSTTLEWAMSELVRNPRVLHKAQAEVREALHGRSKLVEGDLAGGRLSYLNLVIRETLRLHAPLPFLLPRQCREPCEVMGYHIPEGTKVLLNAWALGRDDSYWEDAEAFKPERFEESGTAAMDFKGGHFEYLPFGSGRRMCPGVALGLANMELLLASLLYHFNWELPGGGRPQELDMSEAFGIAVSRKSKLVLRAMEHIRFEN
ncbi:zealexin A1 synthase-like [Triticum dicoccoides]|uniref:zealexin A1 synthase-like n=1 Tax=Triticum dicoccoides TaxID=85692 RepID=UPI00188F6B79|nr:zealexin A1 synthase-like [Triticum dicoccoides]